MITSNTDVLASRILGCYRNTNDLIKSKTVNKIAAGKIDLESDTKEASENL